MKLLSYKGLLSDLGLSGWSLLQEGGRVTLSATPIALPRPESLTTIGDLLIEVVLNSTLVKNEIKQLEAELKEERRLNEELKKYKIFYELYQGVHK